MVEVQTSQYTGVRGKRAGWKGTSAEGSEVRPDSGSGPLQKMQRSVTDVERYHREKMILPKAASGCELIQ